MKTKLITTGTRTNLKDDNRDTKIVGKFCLLGLAINYKDSAIKKYVQTNIWYNRN